MNPWERPPLPVSLEKGEKLFEKLHQDLATHRQPSGEDMCIGTQKENIPEDVEDLSIPPEEAVSESASKPIDFQTKWEEEREKEDERHRKEFRKATGHNLKGPDKPLDKGGKIGKK